MNKKDKEKLDLAMEVLTDEEQAFAVARAMGKTLRESIKDAGFYRDEDWNDPIVLKKVDNKAANLKVKVGVVALINKTKAEMQARKTPVAVALSLGFDELNKIVNDPDYEVIERKVNPKGDIVEYTRPISPMEKIAAMGQLLKIGNFINDKVKKPDGAKFTNAGERARRLNDKFRKD